MPELDDGPAVDLIDRPPPPPSWRDLLDVQRFLGGRPPLRTVGVAAVALGVIAFAVWFVLRPPDLPPIESTLPMAGAAPSGTAGVGAPVSVTTSTVPAEVVVHAAGAVAVPGIHRLPAGSRVADLLAAAGGPTPDADLDRVNLAAALTDGAQVRFPRVGEPAAPAPIGGPASGDEADAGAAPVDLNTASLAELESLPGVGPTIASAIVEHRERNGPFRSVEDLLDVAGIGPAKLDQLRGAVTV